MDAQHKVLAFADACARHVDLKTARLHILVCHSVDFRVFDVCLCQTLCPLVVEAVTPAVPARWRRCFLLCMFTIMTTCKSTVSAAFDDCLDWSEKV